jgi:hypothetical protein
MATPQPMQYMAPINPVQSFMQGAQMGQVLGGAIDRQQAYDAQQAANEQARLKAEEDAKRQAELQSSLQNIFDGKGTTLDYVNYSAMLPADKIKEINATLATKNSEERRVQSGEIASILHSIRMGDTEGAKNGLETRASAIEQTDPEGAKHLREMAISPDMRNVEATFGAILAQSPEGRDALKASDAILEEKRKQTEEPTKLKGIELDNLIKQGQIDATRIANKYKDMGKLAPEDAQKLETDLRKEYNTSPVVQALQTVKGAYAKIQASEPTGTGDISMIFSYMKMLDPTSTVREGEFATAQQSGGIPSFVTNLYNKAVSGEMLTTDQRKQMLSQAKKIFDAAKSSEQVVRDGITRIANKQGLDTSNVFYEQGGVSAPTKKFDIIATTEPLTVNYNGQAKKFPDQKSFDAFVKEARAKGLME